MARRFPFPLIEDMVAVSILIVSNDAISPKLFGIWGTWKAASEIYHMYSVRLLHELKSGGLDRAAKSEADKIEVLE